MITDEKIVEVRQLVESLTHLMYDEWDECVMSIIDVVPELLDNIEALKLSLVQSGRIGQSMFREMDDLKTELAKQKSLVLAYEAQEDYGVYTDLKLNDLIRGQQRYAWLIQRIAKLAPDALLEAQCEYERLLEEQEMRDSKDGVEK